MGAQDKSPKTRTKGAYIVVGADMWASSARWDPADGDEPAKDADITAHNAKITALFENAAADGQAVAGPQVGDGRLFAFPADEAAEAWQFAHDVLESCPPYSRRDEACSMTSLAVASGQVEFDRVAPNEAANLRGRAVDHAARLAVTAGCGQILVDESARADLSSLLLHKDLPLDHAEGRDHTVLVRLPGAGSYRSWPLRMVEPVGLKPARGAAPDPVKPFGNRQARFEQLIDLLAEIRLHRSSLVSGANLLQSLTSKRTEYRKFHTNVDPTGLLKSCFGRLPFCLGDVLSHFPERENYGKAIRDEAVDVYDELLRDAELMTSIVLPLRQAVAEAEQLADGWLFTRDSATGTPR